MQDVLGDTQTRYYAAHYRYTIWACDRHIWPSSMFFEKKDGMGQCQKRKNEAGSTFCTAWNPSFVYLASLAVA
jgi:hypothetical protein